MCTITIPLVFSTYCLRAKTEPSNVYKPVQIFFVMQMYLYCNIYNIRKHTCSSSCSMSPLVIQKPHNKNKTKIKNGTCSVVSRPQLLSSSHKIKDRQRDSFERIQNWTLDFILWIQIQFRRSIPIFTFTYTNESLLKVNQQDSTYRHDGPIIRDPVSRFDLDLCFVIRTLNEHLHTLSVLLVIHSGCRAEGKWVQAQTRALNLNLN
jgi:hypothetical protein